MENPRDFTVVKASQVHGSGVFANKAISGIQTIDLNFTENNEKIEMFYSHHWMISG